MTLKKKLFEIIFGTTTKAGKRFDIILLWVILFSVITVMLESIPQLHNKYFNEFYIAEWIFTIVFTLEYFLRMMLTQKPKHYILSFWGIIDLLSFLPTYISLFITGYHYLLVIRILRMLRIFKILKLPKFYGEGMALMAALKASMYKITIFFFIVLTIVTVFGTTMYVVEHGENGYSSIPQSIYWAIVTITTVGYGDIVPQTVIGKIISSISMIIGYAIIAVPTGIVTVEVARSKNKSLTQKNCSKCNHANDETANFCSNCGHELND
jgi:voltage-gated potassium channel